MSIHENVMKTSDEPTQKVCGVQLASSSLKLYIYVWILPLANASSSIR